MKTVSQMILPGPAFRPPKPLPLPNHRGISSDTSIVTVVGFLGTATTFSRVNVSAALALLLLFNAPHTPENKECSD